MLKNILKSTNLISYLFMMIGVLFLFWFEITKEDNNQYVLITGLAFLIIGIYQLAKKLSSKRAEDYKEPLVRTKKDSEK
ncbi:hypothetical protein [Capnocytophaga catalasegens]|nr:hypothetical protein [Capnocytophaga catalasegens]